jgi:LPXTG-site transpeptidase (sortase) family protein
MRAFIKMATILVLGLLAGAGIVVALHASAHYFIGQRTANADVPATSSGTSATSLAGNIATPLWLVIPRIGVDAPVKPVGVNAEGGLGVPSDAIHVAWYKYGPRPGMPGAAVIDGHLDTRGAPQAVFYNLDKLAPGDEVQVRTENGETLSFQVTAVKEYPYNATDASLADLFHSSSSVPELNLITCAGDWMPDKRMYTERLAVFTQLVGTAS